MILKYLGGKRSKSDKKPYRLKTQILTSIFLISRYPENQV
jgi:hypothetical protein